MFGTFETPPEAVACGCVDKRDLVDEVADPLLAVAVGSCEERIYPPRVMFPAGGKRHGTGIAPARGGAIRKRDASRGGE